MKGAVKTPKSKEPYLKSVSGGKPGECGVGWCKIGEAAVMAFISIILVDTTIDERKVYAGTGMIKGLKDKLLAMIWILKTNCLSP